MKAMKAREFIEADEAHAAAVKAAEAAYAKAISAADASREIAYKALGAPVPTRTATKPTLLGIRSVQSAQPGFASSVSTSTRSPVIPPAALVPAAPTPTETFVPAVPTPTSGTLSRSPSSSPADALPNCLSPSQTSIANEDNEVSPEDEIKRTAAGTLLRPTPPPLQPMPKLEIIRHGLNGSVEQRDIYQTKQHAMQRNIKIIWPQRPSPPTGRMGPHSIEKRWRVDIAHDTLDFLKARNWQDWQPDRVNVRYDPPRDFQLPAPTRTYETQMIVSSEDSLGAALRILLENPAAQCVMPLADIPVVLDMAHWSAAGGGFLHGARAQEEDLCRRTDLYMALRSADYPLPEFGCNYAFPVSILRDSKHTHYKWLQSSACHSSYFPQIGVVCAAAYKDPTVNDAWRKKMRNKIDGMFTGALASGHRIIILSAWGCGAFQNPPDDIARLFHQALLTKFKGRFKQVIFALGTRQSDNNLGEIAVSFLSEYRTKLFRPSRDLEVNADPSMFTFTCEDPDSPNHGTKEDFSRATSDRLRAALIPVTHMRRAK